MVTFRQKLVAEILHNYPFYRGCATIADTWAQKIAGESDEIVWARLRNGKYVRGSLGDFSGRCAFYMGDNNDRKINWLCKKLVRPGDIALDIGANLGIVTFMLASLVGETGHVHAFEPNPQMQGFLEEAIKYNNTKNISLHPCALGTKDTTLDLKIPSGHSGLASLMRNYEQKNPTKIKVQVRSLASILPEIVSKKIRFVKIDVEGFELQVLQGGYEVFQSNPPDIFLVELITNSSSVHQHPTIEILQKLGYDFFSLPKSLMSVRPKVFNSEKSEYKGSDLLAVYRGEMFKEVAELLGATA